MIVFYKFSNYMNCKILGNNWGQCSDGTGKVGCGPQETFRGCSDVRIRQEKRFTYAQVKRPEMTETNVPFTFYLYAVNKCVIYLII